LNKVRTGVTAVTLIAFFGCASVLGIDGDSYVVGGDAGADGAVPTEGFDATWDAGNPALPFASPDGTSDSRPCDDATADPLCEPCARLCEGGACEAGSCELLASGQANPRSVSVDDGGIFWLTSTAVMTCPLSGCPADGGVPLVSNLNEPAFLALDDTFVYWSTPGDLTVSRCSRRGCPDGGSTIAGGVAAGMLARFESSLLFTWTAADGGQLSGLRLCPVDDCEAGAEDLIYFLSAQPAGLVAANPALSPPIYTTATGNEDCVNWCVDTTPAGCGAEDWLTCPLGANETVTGLAVDDGGVYVRSQYGMEVCPLTGPCRQGPFLAISYGGTSPLVAQGGRLYFGAVGEAVRSCAPSACATAPPVANVTIGDPSGLAVDEHFVYVTDRARGLVWRLAH
jgi:hypothetical protein